MRRKPAVDTALHIPDDLLEIYQEEAARQVAESWADRPVPAAPSSPADQPAPEGARPRAPETMLVVAAVLALVGWTVCTAWWTWLAVDTGATLWTAFAGVGIGSLAIATIIALRFLVTSSRPQPADAPRQG